jgi:hypothetical protein
MLSGTFFSKHIIILISESCIDQTRNYHCYKTNGSEIEKFSVRSKTIPSFENENINKIEFFK